MIKNKFLEEKYLKIKPYLPSKNFSIALLSGVLFVGLIFIIGSIDFKKIGSSIFKSKPASETFGTVVEKDTDQDGIKDWEEYLWGTDPYKRDTDDDGTPDSVEIEEKRSKLNESTSILGEEEGEDVATLNETDYFARELFATVIALEQSGNLNEDTLNSLLESFSIESIQISQKKVFTENDFTITEGTDAEKKTYAKEIELVFTENKMEKDMTMDIVSRALESEDSSVLSELAYSKQSYKNFSDDLASIKTLPKQISASHIKTLNTFEGIYEIISLMEQSYENPVLLMSAVGKYLEKIDSLIANLAEFGAILASTQ